MKVLGIHIENFRSIESLDLKLSENYNAISGKNNSGKSNILRTLKALFEPEKKYRFYEDEIKYSKDFPIWKKADSDDVIRIAVTLKLLRISDASVFKLAEEFLKFDKSVSEIELKLVAEFHKSKDSPEYTVFFKDQALDSYKSKQIFNTIKTSGAFQFYNSTEPIDPFESRSHLAGLVGDLSRTDKEHIARDRDKLSNTVSQVAKKHQKDVTELLGRLEEKYLIGLSAPKLNLDFLPINITLGEKGLDVSLDEWGSGTKNRTHILLALFKARKLSESLDDDTKISPILVIEEPESFLHPSAQAEFGRVIQDLSEEFQVQVIVATHSPYFLSQQNPTSNILLTRKVVAKKLRTTEKLDINSDNWMEPFATNLGLSNQEFEPWKQLFFSQNNNIILVEGDIDKEYFELLRDASHGANSLKFQGDIFAYGGVGNIENGILVNFIKNRYSRFFITYDLDSDEKLSRKFESLGMERNKHFLAIGSRASGKKDIEGLLPESVRNTVYGSNADLVQEAINTKGDEQRSAKQRIKKLMLDEFKSKAISNNDFYGEFYKISKIINKAMN